MKQLITIFVGVFLFGCSPSVPLPSQDYGALVLPAISKSPNKKPFTHRYYLTVDRQQNNQIIITPNVTERYVIITGLEPGEHVLTQISGIGRRNTRVRARNKVMPEKNIDIKFSVEPGSITILNEGFFVSSNVIRRNKAPNDTWTFSPITKEIYNSIIDDLASDGYLPYWRVSDSAVNSYLVR